MLTESEVIQAVCRFLKASGFRVLRSLSETEHGIDIEALGPGGQHVAIEAKGETSSKAHTNRYGQPFSSGQVSDHVAKALYCAARDCNARFAGVAFPKNAAHEGCVQEILPTLKRLYVEVFWVLPDGSVQTEHIWDVWARGTASGINAVVLGFDPGGKKGFGWCLACEATDGQLELVRQGTTRHAADAVMTALASAQECGPMQAAAVDSPLFWTGSGDRRVDQIVRKALSELGGPTSSVLAVNSLQGACLVQGVMAALLLREQHPGVRITESHPKALLWLLNVATKKRHVRDCTMTEVAHFVHCKAEDLCDHERDAALGAVAAFAMLKERDDWRDLFLEEEAPFVPVSPVEYWMPICTGA